MKSNRNNRGTFSWGVAITLVVVIGLLAAVGIPNYLKYLKKTKTAEAATNLRVLWEAELTYFYNRFWKGPCPKDGRIGGESWEKKTTYWRQLETSAAFVSAQLEPAQGPKAEKQLGNWSQPHWKTLGFKPDGPTYYSYSVLAAGSGSNANFTARALGDLDGDGITSLFERVGEAELICYEKLGFQIDNPGLYTEQDIE